MSWTCAVPPHLPGKSQPHTSMYGWDIVESDHVRCAELCWRIYIYIHLHDNYKIYLIYTYNMYRYGNSNWCKHCFAFLAHLQTGKLQTHLSHCALYCVCKGISTLTVIVDCILFWGAWCLTISGIIRGQPDQYNGAKTLAPGTSHSVHESLERVNYRQWCIWQSPNITHVEIELVELSLPNYSTLDKKAIKTDVIYCSCNNWTIISILSCILFGGHNSGNGSSAGNERLLIPNFQVLTPYKRHLSTLRRH